MNTCEFAVGIKQLRFRAMCTCSTQSRIQHFPACRSLWHASGFFPERFVCKKHLQRVIIANKNISIDVIQYLLHGSLRLLQGYFNLPAFGCGRHNLRNLAHQFHILFIPLFLPAKIKRKKTEMHAQLRQRKDSDGFHPLYFEHLSYKRIE